MCCDMDGGYVAEALDITGFFDKNLNGYLRHLVHGIDQVSYTIEKPLSGLHHFSGNGYFFFCLCESTFANSVVLSMMSPNRYFYKIGI